MKLFKRTSITLSILIVLLWIFLFWWGYYPTQNVPVSETEKKQTAILLNENNITVPEKLLSSKGRALEGAKVNYVLDDVSVLEEACNSGRLKMDAKDEYSFDDSYLTVVENVAIIEGKSDIADDVTKENALSKAKKLIRWLGLAQKRMSAYVQESSKGFYVVFLPEYDGRPIFDCKISINLNGGGKYRVQTIPFVLEPTKEKMLSCSSCSALAELTMSDTANGSEIREMLLGYKTDGNRLNPAWEIKTVDGNVFYVD